MQGTAIIVNIIAQLHLRLQSSCLEVEKSKWIDGTLFFNPEAVNLNIFLNYIVYIVHYDIRFYFQMDNRVGILIFPQIIDLYLHFLIIDFKDPTFEFSKRLLFLSFTSSTWRFQDLTSWWSVISGIHCGCLCPN